jgi:hypothetical protein
LDLGKGSIPSEHLIFFKSFIDKGFHKIPTVKECLNELKISEIENICKKRNDISALISKRMLNYFLVNEKTVTQDEIDKYKEIIESEKILTPDLTFLSVKKLVKIKKYQSLITSKKVNEILLS